MLDSIGRGKHFVGSPRFSRHAPLSVVAGLLALSVGMVGCGDVNGSDPFAGTVMFVSADQSYHLRLLEPPWIPVTVQGQTLFVVPNSSISLSAKSVSESDALYSLHVTPRPVNAATAFQDSASTQSPPWDLSNKQTLVAIGGQSGVDISWQESDDGLSPRGAHRRRHRRQQLRAAVHRAEAAGRRRHDPADDHQLRPGSWKTDRAIQRAARRGRLPVLDRRRRRSRARPRLPATRSTIPRWRAGSSRARRWRAPAETTPVAGTPAVVPAIAPTARAARPRPWMLAPCRQRQRRRWPSSAASSGAAARRGGIRRIARRGPRARAARRRQDADDRHRLSPLLVRAGRRDRRPDPPPAARPASRSTACRWISTRSRAWSASACRRSTGGRAASSAPATATTSSRSRPRWACSPPVAW